MVRFSKLLLILPKEVLGVEIVIFYLSDLQSLELSLLALVAFGGCSWPARALISVRARREMISKWRGKGQRLFLSRRCAKPNPALYEAIVRTNNTLMNHVKARISLSDRATYLQNAKGQTDLYEVLHAPTEVRSQRSLYEMRSK
jgi:hypothetical protein